MLAVRFVVVARVRFALALTVVFARAGIAFAPRGRLAFARPDPMGTVERFGGELASPRCVLPTLGRTLPFFGATFARTAVAARAATVSAGVVTVERAAGCIGESAARTMNRFGAEPM